MNKILIYNCSTLTSPEMKGIKISSHGFLPHPKVEQKVYELLPDFSLCNWKYLRGKMYIKISEVKTKFLDTLYLNVILCWVYNNYISVSIEAQDLMWKI